MNQKIKNWSAEENNVMKGYILHAINNYLNRDEVVISDDLLDDIFACLGYSTDDLTANDAYNYWMEKKGF